MEEGVVVDGRRDRAPDDAHLRAPMKGLEQVDACYGSAVQVNCQRSTFSVQRHQMVIDDG